MIIYLLLITLIIEFIFCYYIFDKNLFSPSAILSEVFILSTIACIYNIDVWGVNLKISTYLIIVLGNFVFIFISLLIHLLYKKKNQDTKNKKELVYINISTLKLIILLFVYLIFSVAFIKINYSIISSLSINGDMSGAMNLYRKDAIEGLIKLPVWISKPKVVLELGTFVMIYIFINNILVDYKKKSNYILLLCVLLYSASSIFTAQRTTILLTFLYALYVAYGLLNRKYDYNSKINSKYIVKGSIIVILFLLVFGISRAAFGRNDKRTIVDNITYYMGNSIESLDLYLDRPIEKKQFGEETFRQFRVFLSKYKLCEETTMKNVHLEFRRDAEGNSAGNIYTAYRYYIHDFGYESIFIFQIFLAIFFGIWYENIIHRNLKKNIDISFIVFSWFNLCLFRFSLMDSFFSFLAYYIFTHWYAFLFWRFFLGKKFVINEIEI